MIVDTSALIAVIGGEPEGPGFVRAISAAPVRAMSAAGYLETGIVLDAMTDPVVARRFDQFVDAASIEIVPVTAQQARIARAAYRDFGKGSGHRAGLNLGDCFSYALAAERGEPLLFKGDDFVHTDVRPAL